MPNQRLTTQRQLYCALESTEGSPEAFGGNNDVLSVLNLSVMPDQAFYPRQFVGQQGTVTGKIGAQTDPGLLFTVQARGGGTQITPRLDNLYQVVLSPGQLDSPGGGLTTLTNGSSSTVLKVASSTGFHVGNAIAVETNYPHTNSYEVGWIASIPDGSTINLTHALSSNVGLTASSNVLPSITYKPQITGHGSLSFQMYLGTGNDRVSFLGCKGSMKLDVPAPGVAPYLTFAFRSMNWFDASDHTKPTPSYDAAVPPSPYMLKLDSTSFNVKLASWDLRQTVARKYSQNSTTGTISQLVTDRNLLGMLQVYDVDTGAEFSNWTSGTEQAVAQQFGTTQYNMVAYQLLKAQRAKVAYGDDNGLTTDVSVFEGNITNGADEIRLAFL